MSGMKVSNSFKSISLLHSQCNKKSRGTSTRKQVGVTALKRQTKSGFREDEFLWELRFVVEYRSFGSRELQAKFFSHISLQPRRDCVVRQMVTYCTVQTDPRKINLLSPIFFLCCFKTYTSTCSLSLSSMQSPYSSSFCVNCHGEGQKEEITPRRLYYCSMHLPTTCKHELLKTNLSSILSKKPWKAPENAQVWLQWSQSHAACEAPALPVLHLSAQLAWF